MRQLTGGSGEYPAHAKPFATAPPSHVPRYAKNAFGISALGEKRNSICVDDRKLGGWAPPLFLSFLYTHLIIPKVYGNKEKSERLVCDGWRGSVGFNKVTTGATLHWFSYQTISLWITRATLPPSAPTETKITWRDGQTTRQAEFCGHFSGISWHFESRDCMFQIDLHNFSTRFCFFLGLVFFLKYSLFRLTMRRAQ